VGAEHLLRNARCRGQDVGAELRFAQPRLMPVGVTDAVSGSPALPTDAVVASDDERRRGGSFATG
jgi:hypothetical protein